MRQSVASCVADGSKSQSDVFLRELVLPFVRICPANVRINEMTDANVDITFSVQFQHRLRFTGNVLGAGSSVLLDLLEASGDQIPRVQFWIDQYVDEAHPQLRSRLRTLASENKDRFQLASNIQICPGGEAVKNDVHIIERMLKCMNAADLDRRSYVVVIGGGAVLDAVGFAAGISHRGIRLVRLPTTTLAQADSGVGVKNSINLFQKKNWLGSFAVPWGVVNDQQLLSTLPDRDFRCGFSEAVKVSMLKNADDFAAIEAGASAIAARDMNVAWPIIQRSAKLHLDHITLGGDPFEALEARPLDYGHWSAHKLEAMSNYELRHGEAVAIGVAVDTVYSSLVHGLPAADARRVLTTLRNLGLKLDHPVLHETKELFQGLEEFRQHLGGRLTLTMVPNIGTKLDVHTVDRPRMMEAIEFVAAYMRGEAAAMSFGA
ncbi:MAG: 3-dehydroquinate synthase [Planctomycetaceae bacterium]|nr:3-dehydroquinate synthase [Planctomycetaceae bacterium]